MKMAGFHRISSNCFKCILRLFDIYHVFSRVFLWFSSILGFAGDFRECSRVFCGFLDFSKCFLWI